MEGQILLLVLVLAGIGLVDIIRYIYLTLSLAFSTKKGLMMKNKRLQRKVDELERELKDCQL
jgi:hypothetical protein